VSLLRRPSRQDGGSDRPDEPGPTVPDAAGAPRATGSVTAAGSGPEVSVDDGGEDVDAQRWATLARRVLVAEGIAGPAELSLGFVDEPTMAELNHEWMGEEGATDVLSWTLDAPDVARAAGTVDQDARRGAAGATDRAEPVLLGDVVICPGVARRYAAAARRDDDDELALLVVHGILHVLGFDHADPAGEAAMQARETEHLTRFHDPRWTRSPS
jgi:probable rRNA maturation factor